MTIVQFERMLIVAASSLVLSGCSDDRPAANGVDRFDETLSYTGNEVCAGCHSEQLAAWQQSHHSQSMQPANVDSVLGDFSNARFSSGEKFYQFFQRDGDFHVRTNDFPGDDQSSESREYRILYTFGFDPLQQYLIEIEGGRLQALNIAWDSRASAEGGQRWFDLYAGQALQPDDPLHWSRSLHNWNTRCAECHSTHVDKAYRPDTDSFETVWSSVNVSCEACHGAGSAHAADSSVPMPISQQSQSVWAFSDGPIATRQSVEPTGVSLPHAQAEQCAQCHARRSQLAPVQLGADFLDAFEPALLTEGLYHVDGQILDEVFVYGSFAQSAMYAAGVLCTDCHDPHTNALRREGDGLCAGCHRADVFAAATHHRHSESATVPDCVDCHMPAQTYMQIDPRRDHSLRVPMPHLSETLSTPNACGSCHTDQSSSWAAAAVAEWFPDGRWRQTHYGEQLAAGRRWAANRREQLLACVYDERAPAIVRATAMEYLARQVDSSVLDAAEFSLRSSEPLLQLAALSSLESSDAQIRLQFAQRFLDHRNRALRIRAARVLIGAEEQLSAQRRRDFDAAIAEYESSLYFNADTPEGRLGLGLLRDQFGNRAAAEQFYQSAISAEPSFAPAYVNLADLYRRAGREAEANALLREAATTVLASNASVHAAFGFSSVRLGQTEQALASLRVAVELADQDPYYAYTYGLALDSLESRASSLAFLSAAQQRFPGYGPILFALATMYRDLNQRDMALEYVQQLLSVTPGDVSALSLERELRTAE